MEAKAHQPSLFQPLVDPPLAIGLFGHALLAAIEAEYGGFDRLLQRTIPRVGPVPLAPRPPPPYGGGLWCLPPPPPPPHPSDRSSPAAPTPPRWSIAGRRPWRSF